MKINLTLESGLENVNGGDSSANAKLTFNTGSHTIRVGAGGISVGSSGNALSGRGGHGIVILRYNA